MKKKNLKSLSNHLDMQYGEKSTASRNAFEEGFEAFRLGVMIQHLRNENGMTQEQLADKCGTTKSYISRIENNASDIQLGTLMRILKQGFGKDLRLFVS